MGFIDTIVNGVTHAVDVVADTVTTVVTNTANAVITVVDTVVTAAASVVDTTVSALSAVVSVAEQAVKIVVAVVLAVALVAVGLIKLVYGYVTGNTAMITEASQDILIGFATIVKMWSALPPWVRTIILIAVSLVMPWSWAVIGYAMLASVVTVLILRVTATNLQNSSKEDQLEFARRAYEAGLLTPEQEQKWRQHQEQPTATAPGVAPTPTPAPAYPPGIYDGESDTDMPTSDFSRPDLSAINKLFAPGGVVETGTVSTTTTTTSVTEPKPKDNTALYAVLLLAAAYIGSR